MGRFRPFLFWFPCVRRVVLLECFYKDAPAMSLFSVRTGRFISFAFPVLV